MQRTADSVTVVVDFRIYAYLFKPIVDELTKRGTKVHLFVGNGMLEFAQSYFTDSPLLAIRELSSIKTKRKHRLMLHRLTSILFTRSDFSFQFAKYRRQVNYKANRSKRVFWAISRFTPKVPNTSINGLLHAVAGFGVSNPFPTKKVLVGSLNASAELMASRNTDVYTVMESWDHPVKTPNGYRSKKVYVWNEELGADWETCQGDKNWTVFFPLKLRYAIEEAAQSRALHETQKKRNTCVYAVASTDKFSGDVIVGLERRIIRDLCEATQNSQWNLILKVRPNGRNGEFNQFTTLYRHVTATNVQNADADLAANYSYDDKANAERFNAIKGADLVINAFTTFGLDAALAGYPVLQLDLTQTPGYHDSASIYGNNHIKKYLLRRQNVFRPTESEFAPAITDYLLRADLSLAKNYATELETWLHPGRTSQSAISALVDDLQGNLAEVVA